MKRTRRGVSLIELLVVISLLTAVTAFVGRLLYGLLQAEQASTRDVVLNRQLADLALQFRTDIHTAESVSYDEAMVQCRLPANQAVTYRVQSSDIVREWHNGRPHRDVYRLPGAHAKFRPGAPRGVELVVVRPVPQAALSSAAASKGHEMAILAIPRREGVMP